MGSTCYIDGKTYEHKETIKGIVDSKQNRVFSWDASMKEWVAKDVPDEGIDKLAEIVKRRCPGCSLRVKV